MRRERPTPSAPEEAATAVACPNIALIKYWGKRDERLVLPTADSLSLTLDVFSTTTTVGLSPAAPRDLVALNGTEMADEPYRRVTAFLELVRRRAGRFEAAVVDTHNTVPTGAGLASSASGFAALALAASTAYGLKLDNTELSRLARRGSGSASRSVFGGFAVWRAGQGTGDEGDSSSYAEAVPTPDLDVAMVIAVVDGGPKPISSRAAMRRTVGTSPLYRPWVESSRADLVDIRAALERGDLAAVGEIAERNALGMHATMLTARPAVRYMSPATLSVLDRVGRLRRDGILAYATMDAGPNVKVLCTGSTAQQVERAVREVTPQTFVAYSGPGAFLLSGAAR